MKSLQNSQGTLQLQDKLTEYFKIQRIITDRFSNLPVKTSYKFQPQENAWDINPKLIKDFVLHDWIAAMKKLDEDKDKLIGIKDSFVSFNYLRLKDPIALVSIGCQLAVLLVAVAGYIISYSQKPSIIIVFILVVSSMLTSLVLIFFSSRTILNLFIQALVPGAFILYWTYRKHHNKIIQPTPGGAG